MRAKRIASSKVSLNVPTVLESQNQSTCIVGKAGELDNTGFKVVQSPNHSQTHSIATTYKLLSHTDNNRGGLVCSNERDRSASKQTNCNKAYSLSKTDEE